VLFSQMKITDPYTAASHGYGGAAEYYGSIQAFGPSQKQRQYAYDKTRKLHELSATPYGMGAILAASQANKKRKLK